MSKPITVLVVDDHVLLREGLAAYLGAQPDIVVVGTAGDGRAALLAATELRPRVIVMDIDMPGHLSFETTRQLRTTLPGTSVLFLSAFAHDRYVDEAIEAGAAGYLTKLASSETVLEAVRSIAQGTPYYSDEIRKRLEVQDGEGPARSRAKSLTEREIQILKYLGAGYSRKEIAGLLFVSEKTVENHITHVMRKLDLHDRVAVARYAIREGYAKP
jgi:DNA-binding NarL/FixJ family response regulator